MANLFLFLFAFSSSWIAVDAYGSYTAGYWLAVLIQGILVLGYMATSVEKEKSK